MDNLAEQIINAAKTSFIDSSMESQEELRPKLIYNDYTKGKTVLANLDKELNLCESFWFSVAFITKSGIIGLKETLKELRIRGIKGKILTTDYLSFNEPDALRELLEYNDNIEVKIFTKEHFHTKGYMFKNKEKYTFVVGSSNMTQNALKANKEWNLRVTSLENGELINETVREFTTMWEQAIPLTKEWIQEEYEPVWKVKRSVERGQKVVRLKSYKLVPNKMQEEATNNLARLRDEGKNKALLISATGTGKTYLAGFDTRNFNPEKLLFLVHREQILRQALESFKDVHGEVKSMGILSGSSKDMKSDYLFSTVQMMSKESVHLQFAPEHFDYIIIDEVHRAGAQSYDRIIKYFKPKFILGMTATPERSDGYDVYSIFDHNIAAEIRLQQAMEMDMLCPFHYFGIADVDVDGVQLDDNAEFRYLVDEQRVAHIIEKIEFYGHAGNRVKGLIFCSDKKEARELSYKFNLHEYQTIALTGDDSQDTREVALERLEQEDRQGGLDYIFTVDIFNEGVDIPAINQVVMLRPTESAIIFVQQLGRGLRKAPEKEYVVVIDFIGNYSKNFLIPIALSGDRSYNKDTIRKYIAEGNRVIPGCSTVNFDTIAKQRIYATIDTANFSDIKLIKEEYQNLKNMIGRIPRLEDFEKYGSIDVMRIFENKNIGSYHNFLKKYDAEYKIELTTTQEEMLAFVSQKIANGKRIHELQVLKRLLKYQTGIMQLVASDLEKKYGKQFTIDAQDNVARVLTNNFVTNEAAKKKFSNSIFLKEDGEDYNASTTFEEAIRGEDFNKLLEEVLDFGICRYSSIYSKAYKNTEFELYQKYTYEDVCKLLNWDSNMVALNIGGYKYDENTNTFPVFINYNKDESINDSIKYEDRFISSSRLIALSKQSRTAESKDVQHIYNAKENGTKIYLFVRKNKDDNTSKEFYFLGEISAVGEPKPIVMKNVDKNAVEITYQLETAVRDDVYEYLVE